MLTKKQAGLFELLDYPTSAEVVVRARHKMVKKLGAPADFTTWLRHCVEAKWREANKRIYVGD